MTTISKTILTGAEPGQLAVRGPAPGRLSDLAARLAADPDLAVSVITCDDGRVELEVLHTGPPHHTEDTIDRRRFTGRHGAARTVSLAGPAGLQDALALVRGILLEAGAR